MMNLFLAIYNEHEQRTGHDILGRHAGSTLHITCSVCLHLRSHNRELEQAQRQAELQWHAMNPVQPSDADKDGTT